MTHLVKKHDTGEYCISEDDPSPLTGKGDTIILSWENGKRKSSIEAYFSSIKQEGQTIIDYCRENGKTKQDMINMANYAYEEDRKLITDLFEKNFISKGELRRLIYLNRQAEIKQLVVIRDCFKYHVIVSVGSKNKLLLKRAKK